MTIYANIHELLEDEMHCKVEAQVLSFSVYFRQWSNSECGCSCDRIMMIGTHLGASERTQLRPKNDKLTM